MRIQCEQSALILSLSLAGRALSARTPMPILEGIYIEAQDQTVRIMATDLQKGIETILPAQVIEDGATVLPGKLFIEIARRLPEGMVDITAGDTEATIECADFHTTLQTMDAQEFPPLPDTVSANPVFVRRDTLRDMITQTVFAAAVDDSRPILTGVLFEIEADICRVVALDGYRLALRQTSLSAQSGSLSAVVPAVSFGEIAKILGGDEETPAEITLTGSHLFVRVDNTKFVTRLLVGEFIRYRQILPADWQTRVLVNVSQMTQAIERASTLAREGRNNLIRFSISGSVLQIRSNSEIGNAHERVAIELEGKEIEIAFNARYLADVFKNIDDEEAYLCFTTNVSPCIIRPVDADAFLYLVLPVRVFTQ